jgi:hypothetical protein
VEHYENLGVAKHLHHLKYSPMKVSCFLASKVKGKSFEYLMKSHFVSGQVVVGIRHTLPVEDISLLFGIDMACHKDVMAPIIFEKPSYEENEFKKYRDLFLHVL